MSATTRNKNQHDLFNSWKEIASNPVKKLTLTKNPYESTFNYTVSEITSPQLIIPHSLIRVITYKKIDLLETFSDDYLPSAKMARVYVSGELTGIALKILKEDRDFYNQNTSTYTGISSIRQREQGIHRQLLAYLKGKPFMQKVLEDPKNKEHVLELRMLWRRHRLRKLKAIIDMPMSAAVNNSIRYRIDHSDSSLFPSLKHNSLNSTMNQEMVEVLKEEYAPKLIELVENTDIDTIGYYHGIRVRGRRYKPGECSSKFSGKSFELIEESIETRDISALPGGSQENAIIYGEELDRIDRQLINDLQIISPFRIYSPILDSPKMWKFLIDNEDNIVAYDGNKWQSHGPRILNSISVNVNEGWILLSTGHSDTTCATMAAMIGACGMPTVIEDHPFEEGAFFGDDLSAIQPNGGSEELITNCIRRSDKDTERKVHLGMSLKFRRVNAGKFITDRTGNAFRFNKPLSLNGYTRYSDIQKTAIAVQYGLIPWKSPFDYLISNTVKEIYHKDEVFLNLVAKDKHFREMLAYYQQVIKPRWN